ncbi:MAG TPA: CDP-alcohol phosphatidyltransferase family protein [Acidimicrobiales bacterium]|nr:CDP-alcohol phosphatidyltransferase family protein [Acidimicrobiales bacterium]
MFDKRCRAGVERSLRPVGTGLKRAGISADQLTVLGLVLSAACAVAIGNGWLFVGWCLLAASAVPDVLDGAVAKASGTSSPRGAFFDSVVDRVSDTLVLGGLAWYLASTHSPHAALLPLAILGASNLVSYERARAESLGFTARGGLMERAERMIAIGLGLLFSAVLIPLLWLMLGLTILTAVQRFVMVWRQASATVPGRPSAERLAARWSARRPSVGFGDGSRLRGQRSDSGSWRARRTSQSRPATWRRARTRP